MKEEREEVIVHTMNPLQGRGPVYYAALPFDTESSTRQGTKKEEAKHWLVSALWEHAVAREGKLGKQAHYSNRVASPIQIANDLFGKPYLLVGAYPGPAISFSEGGGKVWAALTGDESAIGIDVAEADEFSKTYPLHRVFHPEELQHALRSTKGNWKMASALLWSVKEAVVKALGCAFHLVEPRQMTIFPSGDGDTFIVRLSGKALNRFPLAAQGSLRVRSFSQEQRWLSIAVFNWRLVGNA
jgi:phosphopantetheinyl transferase